jgi:hypothetical protein
MNPQGRIPRSRGAVCGLLLILLGLWAGLAPFIGPYIHFGYTPDRTWAYNSGRLYYSVIPGAAVLLGGVLALVTRNRAVGVCGGVLAVLGGAWAGLGVTFTTAVLKKSILVGTPILRAGAGIGSVRVYLETLTMFTGLALLIAVIGAIAIGRFSMLAASDLGDDSDEYYQDYSATAGFPSATGHVPDTTITQLPPDTLT